MVVEFTRNAKTFQGKVISRGFHSVDAPESYEVAVREHLTIWVPVSDCTVN
jgi:hypothetical protein